MPEMKKVILSKNMPMKKNNFLTSHRKAYPKKTLLSTWETRNDSSNVNAILHPDPATPRKFIRDIPTKPTDENRGVYKKCCLSNNTCYCREKPIKPRMLSRPNKCLSLEAFRRRMKFDDLSRTSLRCLCRVSGDDASADYVNMTDSDMIERYREELKRQSTSLHHTDQRKDYNVFREEQHEEYLKDIEEYEGAKEAETHSLEEANERYLQVEANERHSLKERNERQLLENKNERPFLGKKNGSRSLGGKKERHLLEKKNEIPLLKVVDGRSSMEEEKKRNAMAGERKENDSENDTEESISTLLGTRQANSKLGSSGFLTEGLNVEELKKFRDDHYFETHAVDLSYEDVPKHTCIHQFKLDDRLLPAPMNADPYGRSRCSICNKPMEGDRVQLSSSYFSEKPSRVSLENFSKCYRMGLVPRSISIGGDKSKIELKLNEKNINQFGLFIGKYKRPQYTNTYALRQQKMAC